MARTLVTGGSGFIATHVIEALLKDGHSVVTTVRSPEKAEKIKSMFPGVTKQQLDFVIVEDIAKPDAFDKAVVSEPPFEIVMHTASPFTYDFKDPKKDLIDPAVIGTTSILKAIKKSAPTVKSVVVTSSLAAVRMEGKPAGYKYTEADWCTLTVEDAVKDSSKGYRASKTLAERAAWKFVEDEKPNFTLSTINPTLVYGPVAPHSSLSAINTSNQKIYSIMSGGAKEACPVTGGNYLWVDVRDVADAHLVAATKPEAAGKRFLLIGGTFTNKEIVEIIAKDFPDLKNQLPTGEALEKGGPVADNYTFDNSRATDVLGIKWKTLRASVGDTVKSLQALKQES